MKSMTLECLIKNNSNLCSGHFAIARSRLTSLSLGRSMPYGLAVATLPSVYDDTWSIKPDHFVKYSISTITFTMFVEVSIALKSNT